MKLTKTRQLLKDFLHKEQINAVGRPTPHFNVKEVGDEMRRIEKRYIIYRSGFWVLVLINLSVIFLLIIGNK